MSWADLLPGALGGVVVLVLGTLVRWAEERRRRKRELVGLLRALYFEEIVPTRETARRLDEDPSLIIPEMLPALGQEIWSGSRFRIAELADAQLFGSLAKYYAYLKALNRYVEVNQDQRKREEYGRPMAAKAWSRGGDLAARIEPMIGVASAKRGTPEGRETPGG